MRDSDLDDWRTRQQTGTGHEIITVGTTGVGSKSMVLGCQKVIAQLGQIHSNTYVQDNLKLAGLEKAEEPPRACSLAPIFCSNVQDNSYYLGQLSMLSITYFLVMEGLVMEGIGICLLLPATKTEDGAFVALWLSVVNFVRGPNRPSR